MIWPGSCTAIPLNVSWPHAPTRRHHLGTTSAAAEQGLTELAVAVAHLVDAGDDRVGIAIDDTAGRIEDALGVQGVLGDLL